MTQQKMIVTNWIAVIGGICWSITFLTTDENKAQFYKMFCLIMAVICFMYGLGEK